MSEITNISENNSSESEQEIYDYSEIEQEMENPLDEYIERIEEYIQENYRESISEQIMQIIMLNSSNIINLEVSNIFNIKGIRVLFNCSFFLLSKLTNLASKGINKFNCLAVTLTSADVTSLITLLISGLPNLGKELREILDTFIIVSPLLSNR
jgi:DNA topoisomerase VI subunit B